MRKKKKKPAILRLHKKMPCPTGTKVFADRKKEISKKKCRGKVNELEY